MKLTHVIGAIAVLSAAGATTAWAAHTVGPATLSPSSITVNTPTPVTVAAVITDVSLIPGSVNLQRMNANTRVFQVIATLQDDGTGTGRFATQVSFNEPTPFPVTLRVSAAFRGMLTRVFSPVATLTVAAGLPPSIVITNPPNLSFTNSNPITVTGTVSDPNASVTVNGVVAPAGSGAFSVSLPLIEGNNTITAAATSNAATSTASIQVTLDTTPPRATILSPLNGFVTTDSTVTVSGTANDTVVGTVNDQQVQVRVNGFDAVVQNRSFQVIDIPVAIGDNVITATAHDRAGNGATATITIRRDPPTQPHIQLVSGNNQRAAIGSPLASPLVVGLFDANNNPVSNQTVVFAVTQNNGSLDAGQVTEAVTTNSQGQAQVHWTVGTRSGAGNNTVIANATGFDGSAVFTASGSATNAALINMDAGTGQTGVAGQALPHPFVAVVTDAGHNRLGNVSVTFRVTQGGGTLGGQSSVTTMSDSDGRALATLTLGPRDGISNNVVEATFTGNPGFPAAFVATGRALGDPAATRITGVVLDNSNNPVPGATIRAYLTNVPAQASQGIPPSIAVQSDLQGQFAIQPAPVGFVKLIADGSTVTRPGQWPNLEYDLVTVAGRNNTIGMPIYLLPLDTTDLLCVSETAGGTLTLPQVPGFSMTVQPGSATFPGGSKTGCISVTPVHPDKIPMVPGFGQQPRFIVTIQPAGTLFNPPAAITVPNLEALGRREVTEMYSFDHDLGTFVSIGTGTVSDDGTVVQSDPGVGVLKAGWFCDGNPGSTGSAGVCPVCKQCNGSDCVPSPLCVQSSCTAGSACDGSGSCKTGRDLIPMITDRLSLAYANQQTLSCAAEDPAFCGPIIQFAITRVNNSCDSTDVAGALLTEELTSDHGCGTPVDFPIETCVTNGTCPTVEAGNRLPAGVVDKYELCARPSVLPAGTCTEHFTQKIFLDGVLIETHTITFTITNTATACSGTATRQ
jgi:hypothetical protein